MTSRSISTTHATISCDVCGRNLLRGERSAAFLAAGERRTVCNLCVPRAEREGWQREGAMRIAPEADAGRARRLLRLLRPARPDSVTREPLPVGGRLGLDALAADWLDELPEALDTAHPAVPTHAAGPVSLDPIQSALHPMPVARACWPATPRARPRLRSTARPGDCPRAGSRAKCSPARQRLPSHPCPRCLSADAPRPWNPNRDRAPGQPCARLLQLQRAPAYDRRHRPLAWRAARHRAPQPGRRQHLDHDRLGALLVPLRSRSHRRAHRRSARGTWGGARRASRDGARTERLSGRARRAASTLAP
jgi:hypothetical protein